MNIGIGFNGVWIPVREAIKRAHQAEKSGYESVWVAEDSPITGRDAISSLACMAYLTERVKLGTNLIPVYHNRHLYLTAVTAATNDEISNGRLILGIGAGTMWPSYPPDVKPIRMMKDTILGLRCLLAEQEFEYEGKLLKLRIPEQIFSWDLPKQVRARIPIYLGARGPRMTQLAGELADGILLELYLPSTEIKKRLKNLEIGAKKVNRDPTEINVTLNVHIYVTENGELGKDIRSHIANWIAHRVSDEVAEDAGLDLKAIELVRSSVRNEGHWAAASLVDRQMVEAFCAAGTPDKCLEKLREYQSVGITRAILLPFGGDLDLTIEVGGEFARKFNDQ
jgi:5,10-methylenetetrahydromethanopterin reductase